MVYIFLNNFFKKKNVLENIDTINITSINKISPPNTHKELLHSQSTITLKDKEKNDLK